MIGLQIARQLKGRKETSTMEHDLKAFASRFGIDRNPWSNPKGHHRIPRQIAEDWEKSRKINAIEFELGGILGLTVYSPPPEPDKPFYLFIAHHDTIPYSPGFDDNLSGMATINQLLLEDVEGRLNGNLAFALTDFEEGHPRIWEEKRQWEENHGPIVDGSENYYEFQRTFIKKYGGISSFHGCKVLIKKLREERRLTKLAGVINFESVGYFGKQQKVGEVELPEEGDYLVAVGNSKGTNLLGFFPSSDFLPYQLKPLEFNQDARRSDHALFWDIGIPAVMVTDTANYRNPNYHTSEDTYIDYSELSKKIKRFISGFNQIVPPQ